MWIKIILVVFIIFVLTRIFFRLYKKQISRKETIIWVIFWVFVGLAAAFPEITDYLASLVGVGRGLDLVLPVSVAIIFYTIFKLIMKIDRLEQDITRLTRQQALQKSEDKKNPQA